MGKVFKALDRAARERSREADLLESDEPRGQDETEERDAPVPPRLRDRNKQNQAHIETRQRKIRKRPRPTTGAWDPRLNKALADSGAVAESIRALRTRILHPPDGRPLKSLLVTSTMPGEGKSFVCANLGITLAQGVDNYSLIVDSDLRKPSLHKLFGLEMDEGLTEYLRDGRDLKELIVPSGIDTLSLLPAGHPPVNPAELISSESMARLIDELESRYEDRILLLDSPPMQAASETLVLAQQVDGIILVVRWGASRREHVQKVIEQIGRNRLVGVVFNAYQATVLDSKVFGHYEYYQGYYGGS